MQDEKNRANVLAKIQETSATVESQIENKEDVRFIQRLLSVVYNAANLSGFNAVQVGEPPPPPDRGPIMPGDEDLATFVLSPTEPGTWIEKPKEPVKACSCAVPHVAPNREPSPCLECGGTVPGMGR